MPPQVNQLGLYGGFIGNYEEAVEVVRRCSQADVRFRTLAEVRQAPPPAVTPPPTFALKLTNELCPSPEHDVQRWLGKKIHL